MPVCQHCHTSWTWKETLLKSFFRVKMRCSYCDETQYITTESRKKMSLMTIIPFLAWIPLSLFDVSFSIIFMVQFMILILVVLYMPNLTELSSREERLW